MPTAASSTDLVGAARTEPTWVQARRAIADVAILVRFRATTVGRRGALRRVLPAFVLLTVGAAVGPAFAPGAAGSGKAFNLLLLLPTAMAGFLVLAVVSGIASGGGRELLARDPAQVFPVSATTDHLGALLLAPLNIAWLIQAWVLLGSTAYALGPDRLLAAQIGMVLWIALATSTAQVAAWVLEAVRRSVHGVSLVRGLTVIALATAIALQVTDTLVKLLDNAPTSGIVIGLVGGFNLRWVLTVLLLALAVLVTIAVGAVPAHLAGHKAPRDELRAESGRYQARALARSDLAMLVRIDRASVWRAVPMRRGLAVLAIGPGVVALIGDLPWSSLTILPGLVASGGALLFGVNAWCLDGRGTLWRESLPVAPSTVFTARAWVLAEFLLAASVVTALLAALRAGVPSAVELTAVLGTLLVVTVQVVAAALRWSSRHPYAVDLRSARATPAPPLAMVGYSTRLAVSTTLTGLVFSGVARAPDWRLGVLVAVPFLAWSSVRLLRTRREWLEPVGRARVVMAVVA